MKATLPLRIASVLSLLFAAGHAAGGLKSWSPAGQTRVLGEMQSFRFEAAGAMRSYLDFYVGFGLLVGAYLLLQAIVLWQLAAIAKSDPPRVRPILASFLLMAVASTYLCSRFIFIVPAAFSAAIAACLAVAFYSCMRYRRPDASCQATQ